MLLGKIDTVDENGDSNIEELLTKIEEDPSLSHGVYVTTPLDDNSPPEAYVIAIIDPLTGFT